MFSKRVSTSSIALAAVVCAFSGVANAAPVTVQFDTQFNFDPNQPLTVGGDLSGVFDDAFGTTGAPLDVSVSFTYDNANVAALSSSIVGGGSAAAFNQFLTSLTVTINNNPFVGMINAVNNAVTTEGGFFVSPTSAGLTLPEIDGSPVGFAVAQGGVASGNAMLLGDENPSSNTVGGVTQTFFGDSATFIFGGTSSTEFSGELTTGFGELSLSAFGFGAQTGPGENIIDGVDLASAANIFDPANLSSFFVAMTFAIDGVVQPFTLRSDQVTFASGPDPMPGPDPIPVPGAIPLMVTGLAGLAALRRRKRES